jgi:hypothetical protein
MTTEAGTGIAVATSRDGRSFAISSLSGTALGAGAIVALLSEDGTVQLGQIQHDDPSAVPAALGRLLGSVDPDGRFDATTTFAFTHAQVTTASDTMIQTMHSPGGATLDVGTDLTPPGGPSRLLPHRFNRHTFGAGRVVPERPSGWGSFWNDSSPDCATGCGF